MRRFYIINLAIGYPKRWLFLSPVLSINSQTVFMIAIKDLEVALLPGEGIVWEIEPLLENYD